MNISPSQCGSSGCEPGWTFYLDQSSYYSQTQRPNEEYVGKGGIFMAEEAAEVDLSMVSDASSGPKRCYDDYDQCSEPVKKRSKAKKKIKEHDVDDDTATSPLTSFSKKSCSKKLDFSQSFSGTCFKGKSTLHLKPGNKAAGTKDSGDFQERNWD